jgi:hypothetical protein
MSSRRDQISAGVTRRYLRRYLQIFMKVSAYNTIVQYYLLEAQLPCLRRRTQITRSPRTDHVRRVRRVCRDCVPACRRCCLVVVRHHRRPGPPPPTGRRRRFRGGTGAVSSLLSSIAFVLPTLSRRRPASSPSGWGKTTGPPRPPPAMSFPSGNIVVTPFVGAHDDNDGTVAPPQGSEFFEDVEGDYYDGLQNEDGDDCIALGSAVLRPRQTWGGA